MQKVLEDTTASPQFQTSSNEAAQNPTDSPNISDLNPGVFFSNDVFLTLARSRQWSADLLSCLHHLTVTALPSLTQQVAELLLKPVLLAKQNTASVLEASHVPEGSEPAAAAIQPLADVVPLHSHSETTSQAEGDAKGGDDGENMGQVETTWENGSGDIDAAGAGEGGVVSSEAAEGVAVVVDDAEGENAGAPGGDVLESHDHVRVLKRSSNRF